jgi:TRAP-type C4-dicarboxylate transport system permease large subunit/TRAP-type C4-dicarboxylate transport system permease small subunit
MPAPADVSADPPRARWPGRLLDGADSVLTTVATAVVIVIFALDLILTIVNVVSRSLFDYDIIWSQQASISGIIAVALLGGALAYRHDEYIRLRAVTDRLDARKQAWVAQFVDTATLFTCLTLTVYGIRFCQQSLPIVSPELHISEFWLNLPIPVGLALITLFAARRLLTRSLARLGVTLTTTVLSAVISFGMTGLIGQLTNGSEIAITLIATVAFLLLGAPIAFAFLFSSITYLYLSGSVIQTVPSSLGDGLQSFLLLAIPFFLVAGFLLGRTGLSGYLTSAARAVVWRLPGSVLHVVVIAMYLFSGISGSKLADMAAVAVPALRMSDEEGYERKETVAILSASASMGDTVPPSLGLIVLSSTTALSTGALFLAGLIPATITAVFIMVLIIIRDRRSGRQRSSGGERPPVLLSIVQAVPVLAIVVLIIGGVVGGFSTPEESSALAVAYTLLLLGIVWLWQRGHSGARRAEAGSAPVRPAALAESAIRPEVAAAAIREGMVTAGGILFLFTCASLFGKVLTLEGLPGDITDWLQHSGGKVGFLILSLVALMIIGMVMEGLPAIIVFAPILLPIATGLGVNSLQYGILLVMAIGMGANSPPFGIGLYVAAQLGGTTVGAAGRIVLRYLVPLIAGVAVVAAAPVLTTWLPQALGVH